MAGKQGVKPPKQKSISAGKQRPGKKQGGMSWITLVAISAVIAVLSYFTYTEIINPQRYLRKLQPPVGGLSIDRKKWGSYRSHTYFGLRTRDPRSPLFGVMWYEQPEVMQMPRLRHWCDQGDDLKNYGWYAADGRTFGRENVTERTSQLSFDWINDAEAWTARMRIEPKTKYTVILYMVAQVRLFEQNTHVRTR
ncbi:hypothetical protein COOONC_00811 [Cooperia oncophora]